MHTEKTGPFNEYFINRGGFFFSRLFTYTQYINFFFTFRLRKKKKKTRFLVVSATAAVTVYPAHVICIEYNIRARRLRTQTTLD